MMQEVTKEELERMNACESQLRLFCKVFPGGVIPTRESLHRAVDAGLDVFWYARQKLGGSFETEGYALAMEHDRLIQAEVSRNLKVTKEFRLAYDNAQIPLWDTYCRDKDDIYKGCLTGGLPPNSVSYYNALDKLMQTYTEALTPLKKKLYEELAPFLEEHQKAKDAIHEEYVGKLIELILQYQEKSDA